VLACFVSGAVALPESPVFLTTRASDACLSSLAQLAHADPAAAAAIAAALARGDTSECKGVARIFVSFQATAKNVFFPAAAWPSCHL